MMIIKQWLSNDMYLDIAEQLWSSCNNTVGLRQKRIISFILNHTMPNFCMHT